MIFCFYRVLMFAKNTSFAVLNAVAIWFKFALLFFEETKGMHFLN